MGKPHTANPTRSSVLPRSTLPLRSLRQPPQSPQRSTMRIWVAASAARPVTGAGRPSAARRAARFACTGPACKDRARPCEAHMQHPCMHMPHGQPVYAYATWAHACTCAYAHGTCTMLNALQCTHREVHRPPFALVHILKKRDDVVNGAIP